MTIWFTADTHFGHTNIIKYCNRPFVDRNEMDECLIAKCNQLVKPSDILYHLGDFCFGKYKNLDRIVKEYRERLHCNTIHLVYGNHDKRMIGKYFSSDREIYTDLRLDGNIFTLCHYALAIWNKSHRGAYHFYGHSHAMAEENLDRLFPERRSVDVGVDNAFRLLGSYRPFSLEELLDILKDRTGFQIDHHKNT